MNWSRWIRQTHRWLSIVFTVAVIINGVTAVQGRSTTGWVYSMVRRERHVSGSATYRELATGTKEAGRGSTSAWNSSAGIVQSCPE